MKFILIGFFLRFLVAIWNGFFGPSIGADSDAILFHEIAVEVSRTGLFDTKYNINNLEPVGNWGADPAVLIVGKDSQFNTAQELVAFAKQNPGKVTVSGAGKFVGHHIAHLQLAKAAGIDLKYIPGKGGVGAMQLVKGGQVKAGFNNLSDAARAQGDIKILAVADLERHAFLPDVPTLMELGILVDNSSVNFRGLMVPKGTPADVISYLEKAVPVMFNDKKTLGKMKQTNSPVRIMTRNEVIAMWKERQAALTELLKDLK